MRIKKMRNNYSCDVPANPQMAASVIDQLHYIASYQYVEAQRVVQ